MTELDAKGETKMIQIRIFDRDTIKIIEAHEGDTIEQAIKILSQWSQDGDRFESYPYQGKHSVYIRESGSLELSDIHAVIVD